MLETPAVGRSESPATLDLNLASSVALRRLVDEVRNEVPPMAATAYNRTYHRHNR
ncbi:YhhA family cyclophane-containing RiPP [Sphingopyxis lindanitolerans]|uniref:YhhA family cyclophane-containing RiPP n=1 Tax=Sphingopyxis lindanitolerans TaxID=2054227 RepID=UPI0026C507E4